MDGLQSGLATRCVHAACMQAGAHHLTGASCCRTRSRTRWARSWMRAGELPRPTGTRTRRRRLVTHWRVSALQEVDEAARQAGLLRLRLGAIQNTRGAPHDRAAAHDRAPRPCHRRRLERDDRGGQAGPVVDAHARDARTGAGALPSTRATQRDRSRWLGVTAELNSARLGRTEIAATHLKRGVEIRSCIELYRMLQHLDFVHRGGRVLYE